MEINLISDTVTKPSPEMLQAMFHAKVGDDVFKQDPTVNDFEQKVAELFGTTVQTIITWKKKGKIPFFQLGRFPIFSKKQLTMVASKNQHLIRS